jgi:excisionase family DNA binding protein
LADQLGHWKSQAEAAEILKCSEKTISRMAGQGKIEKAMRRVPGRKPMPVFNPTDIERLRRQTVDLKPFPVEEAKEEQALAPRPSQDGASLFAQLLADRLGSAQAVPLERKVFLNLEQASEYTGMPKEWLRRQIKKGDLPAILSGGWRIRRADLEKL